MSTLVELREARDTLLQIANPDRVLRYADELMNTLRSNREIFELPAAHAWLKPILEYYTDDLDGWVKFLKNVRDRLEPKSDDYKAVYEFYKVINVRAIQRRTRALIDVATNIAVRKGYLEDTWDAKQRYAKRCVQAWKLRKDTLLTNIRKASPTGRVSVHHREEVLAEFWDKLADEVNRGEVPKP